MSKEGRFYRIRLKTGGVLDAVPAGSLADGMKNVPHKKGRVVHHIGPDIAQLWEDFIG